MSIDSDSVICTECDFRMILNYRPILLVYEFNKNKIELGRSYGWCWDCKNICDIEPKFDVDIIESELEEVRKESESKGLLSRIFNNTEFNDLKIKIVNLKTELDIAKFRLNQRRCLNCGSNHTQEISSFYNYFFKHTCGGHLHLKDKSSADEQVRFFYKLEKINLTPDGYRVDRTSYPKIYRPTEEDIKSDIYQQIIDGVYDIEGYFRGNLGEVDYDEILFFAMAITSYLMLRFGRLSKGDVLLDELTLIFIEDINHQYVDDIKDDLIKTYQIRYKEYISLINLVLEPETSKSNNPTLTLSLHLYEMVTKKTSRGKMLEIVFLSKLVTEFITSQIKFVKLNLNQG